MNNISISAGGGLFIQHVQVELYYKSLLSEGGLSGEWSLFTGFPITMNYFPPPRLEPIQAMV